MLHSIYICVLRSIYIILHLQMTVSTLTYTIKHTKNMLLRVYLRSQVSMGNGDSRIGESVRGWTARVPGLILSSPSACLRSFL